MYQNMNKYIFSVLSVFVVAFVFTSLMSNKSYADTCTTQYGNGEYGTTTCTPTDVTLDKKVRNPITGVYVDNLLSGDASYSPGNDVLYILKITNSSNQNFSEVKVTDTLPEKFVRASVTDDNKNLVKDESFTDNKLTFKLKDEFKANTSIEIHVTAKLKNTASFSGKSRFCGNEDQLQNNADVTAQDRHDQDSSSLCVETSVLGTTTLPTAGVTDILPMLPFIGSGLTGLLLIFKRKK